MKPNQLRNLLVLCLLATANAPAAVLYVDVNSASPAPPFLSWATAATNIQDAVDAAIAGDQILVTNGVYQTGGQSVLDANSGKSGVNRVAVTNAVAIQSVNGPEFTTIIGGFTTTNHGFAVRCVYLTDGASLSGFTLTNGLARLGGGAVGGTLNNCKLLRNYALGGPGVGGGFNYGGQGGGAYDCKLNNCTLTGNSAYNEGSGGGASFCTLNNCSLTDNSAAGGGGAEWCTLNNCTLSGNSASGLGGGAIDCTMNNCILSGNSAMNGGGVFLGVLNNCILRSNRATNEGGGVYAGNLINCTVTSNSAGQAGGGAAALATLKNCIVYYNTAPTDANVTNCELSYCCTTAILGFSVGNITQAPLFQSQSGGNLRLQSTSPCINAGNNAEVTTATDLDGRPRIIGDHVDMGAYEFQGPFMVWLQQFGLPTGGSADFTDADADGLNNLQEWSAGTIPTNALSVLKLMNPIHNASNLVVTWQSVSNRTYFLQRSVNLGANPAFLTLAADLTGQAGTTSYTDSDANGPGPYFYRVAVQPDANQFTYIISSATTIRITGYRGSGGAVIIPGTIFGRRVTSIGDYAFLNKSAVTSVWIPNGVTNIGFRAFFECTSLVSVTIPNSVTSFWDSAFSGCTNLTSITIPDSVTSLGIQAFWGCTSLTSVMIGNGVTSIGIQAFDGCTSLTRVTIGNGVTNIGIRAFFYCTSLTSIVIPNSVISIGYAAFSGCTSLTNITIPNSVTSIEQEAFSGCTSLTNITIPNSVISIGDGAFYRCTSLTSIAIPNSVSSIGAWAFRDCISLASITIPNSATSIGVYAFHNCTSLASITVGNGVISIGDYAFASCFSLTGVYFRGDAPSVGSDAFISANNATVYYLPGTTGWGTTFGGRPTAFWSLPYPLILDNSPSFGVRTNRFGFIVSWATNIPVVVEASTSLAAPDWSPVATNTLTAGASYFSDPQWTNYPNRFYRLRSP